MTNTIPQSVTESAKSHAFNYNISHSTLLKYLNITGKSNHKTITPLIDNGDTLAFYIQFLNGWEIIAADKRLSPVILKSDFGEINFSNPNDENLRQLNGLLYYLKEFRFNHYNKINGVWKIFETPKIINTIRPCGYGQGMWIPQDTVIEERTEVNPPIVKTEWGQSYPWYMYTKRIEEEMAVVGCGPVATGQVIYHFRSKNHRDCVTPTEARYHTGNDVPQYSNFTTSSWSQMEKSISSSGTYNHTASFLGYLGKQMNVSYGITGSYVSSDEIKKALNTYKLTCKEANSYNYFTIYSNLISSDPVIVCATGKAKKEDNSYDNIAHIFLINGYAAESTYAHVTYIWDPDHNITEWEFDHIDQSMFSNASGNDSKEEDIKLEDHIYFRMNWGHSGSQDNNLYSAAFINYGFIENGVLHPEYNQFIQNPYWSYPHTNGNQQITVIYDKVSKIFYDIQEKY